MTQNSNILKQLNEFKQLITVENLFTLDNKKKIANNFRIRSYLYAIKVVESFSNKIKNIDELIYSGIGKTILSKIEYILKKKTELPELRSLRKKLKKYYKKIEIINKLEEIIGIGNKQALKLIYNYDVKSINDLKKKIKDGIIIPDKTILLGLKYYNKIKKQIPRNEVTKIAGLIKNILFTFDKNLIIYICGSYRRQLKYCNDIDVIITHKNYDNQKNIVKTGLLEKCVDLLKNHKIIIEHITYKNYTTKYMGLCRYKNNPIRRIDIRIFAKECLPTALTYFTGPYEFNTKMRQYAKRLGFKLNEYGLYKNEKKINVVDEKDLFKKLNLKWIEPYNRQ